MTTAYKRAGVDIDAKYGAVEAAKTAIRGTFTPGVVSDIGLFGGLFDPERAGIAGQILVASTDGVGTKVRIAATLRRYDTVGQCIVNHCVNDILVQGAAPLFFLDYVGMGKLVPEVVTRLIEGMTVACRAAGCALIGGETAEMPGLYPDGEFELVGTILGAVPRDRVLDGSRVRAGDVLICLPSSGLHTNGYSLARRVLADRGWSLEDRPPGFPGTLGEALLAVHRSYLGPVLPLLRETDAVHACAHITGGGLYDNLPRVLAPGLGARVRRNAMAAPPIFDFLVREGGIDDREAHRVLNMGYGFLLIVERAAAGAVRERLIAAGEDAREVGEIVAGASGVELV